MKKILFVLLTLFFVVQAAQAVPALRGQYQYKQPDGTVITLENHGDEYYHWTTDGDGNTVELDDKGFYRIVSVSTAEHRARYARARSQFRARWSSYDEPFSTNFGDRKILCILAEFLPETEPGRDFNGEYIVENPQEHFWKMLNEPGYSFDGAIGSVRDYYLENSGNQYRPSFDVFGPVTLSHPESYYDQKGVSKAILEAYELLKDDIVIEDYDTDNDGNLDMVLFYFPGHNEAEHAPSWTIWPHQGTNNYGRMGTKKLVRYFCTSELRGQSGDNVAAIGTTCHEFAHSLGLPDFYAVAIGDGEEENSIQECTYKYDLMCYGNYNDDGRRPPYLTSLERNMLGWMQMPETIVQSGDRTLEGVQNNKAYRIDAQVDGEFFLLECRNGKDWDSATPANGLVVFHIDQSLRNIGGVTPAGLWESTNNINSYGGHPCYAIVPSWKHDTQVSNRYYAYPGQNSVRTFVPMDWDDNPAGVSLTNIAFDGSKVTFTGTMTVTRQIFGNVTDLDGAPLKDVQVVLSRSVAPFAAAPSVLSTDLVCMTDANGFYSFELADDATEYQVISARKSGYISVAENLTVSSLTTVQDFVLFELGQAPPASLKKYDETQTRYTANLYGPTSIAAGMLYTSEELSNMGAVGAAIEEVSFMVRAAANEPVYVVVQIGEERTLVDVSSAYKKNEFVTVDISGENLVIPSGKDVYIAVGLDNIDENSRFYMFSTPSDIGGCYVLWGLYDGEWESDVFDNHFNFAVSATLSMRSTSDFAAHGVSYVKLVDGVPQAVSAAGKTVRSVTWYVDEVAVNGTPPAVSTLSSGAHTYKAVLQHYDGTSERVYYDVVKE